MLPHGLTDNTYGIATRLPWGVDFGDGVSRHPTQVYESIFALGLFAFLCRMLFRPHRVGDVFRAFMVSYSTWRLAIDFLKPEIRFVGLSAIQRACAGMLAYHARDIRRWIETDAALAIKPANDAFGAPGSRHAS